MIIGGAPVDQGLVGKLRKVPTAIYETYGMTETITHIAVKEINPISKPYFKVLPNVTVSTDSRGCLVIDAPKVSDTGIVTNDMVELTADNQFTWLGRYDSIINSGGVKLFPEKIERSLSGLIANRFFVAGIPDETLGQKLILVVEGDSMDGDDLLHEIKMQEKLSKYEVPKAIYFVKTFVETSTRKIDRLKTISRLSF